MGREERRRRGAREGNGSDNWYGRGWEGWVVSEEMRREERKGEERKREGGRGRKKRRWEERRKGHYAQNVFSMHNKKNQKQEAI